MQLRTLARTGIVGCAAGILLLLATAVHLADAYRQHEAGMANLDQLQFAVARLGIEVNRVVDDSADAPAALDESRRQLEIIDESLRRVGSESALRARDKVAGLQGLVREIERGLAREAPGEQLRPLVREFREAEAEFTLAESAILRVQYDRLDRRLMSAVALFGGISIGLILVCLALFVFFARRIHRPLNLLAHAFGRAREGDFDQQVDTGTGDEFGELAHAFNTMLDQRRAYEQELHEQAHLLEIASRLAHFGGWSIDLQTRRVIWSDEVAAIHGMPPGTSPTVEEGIRFFAPEWRDLITERFTACARDGVPYDEELQVITARGRRVWVRAIGEAVYNEQGAITHVRGAFQEITSRKESERKLRERTSSLRERVKELRCINAITLLLDRLDQENQTFEQVMHEVVRTIPPGWRYPDVAAARIEAEGERFDTPGFRATPWMMEEAIHIDGAVAGNVQVVYLEECPELEEGPFLEEERDLLRMIASKLGSVLQQRATRLRLQRMAYEDELTGLYSRAGFTRRLESTIAELPPGAPAYLVVLDLSHLNDVNQTYGYELGDQLLVALASRLRDIAPEPNFSGRLGGDQFALFLQALPPECGNVGEFVRWLQDVITTPFSLSGHDIRLGITLGVALRDSDDVDSTELMRRALLAFHGARDDEMHHTMVYAPALDRRARDRSLLVSDLRVAVASEQFELHYQPRVRLDDGRITGVEVLLRWRHPTRGLLSPDVFIPVAEYSRLIIPIGEVVMREACARLQAWQQMGLPDIPVAVNVSMIQILDPGFVDMVEGILRETATDAAGLVIEITESVLEKEPERVFDQIKRLHDLGVRLSLDDFGTGYSSLAHLDRYPFDEIKIDRTFVNRAGEQAYSREIVRMIVRLAQVMGSEVVAEGIETRAQRDLLLELGCTFGQGYFYTRPLSEHDFLPLLESGWVSPADSH